MAEGETEDQKDEGPKQGDLDALKQKNEELVGEVRKLSEKLKAFGEMTPEAAKEAARKAREAEEAELSAKGQYEELKRRLQDENREKVETLEAKLAERDTRLHKLLVEDELSKAMDEAGVLPSRKEYVRRYFLAEGPVLKDDRGIFERSDGDVPIAVAVKKWAETDEADAFVAGDPKNGTGTRNSGNGTGGGKSWKEMTMTEQGQMYRDNPNQAKQLAAAAGVTLGGG